jgi:hypothetical protein
MGAQFPKSGTAIVGLIGCSLINCEIALVDEIEHASPAQPSIHLTKQRNPACRACKSLTGQVEYN